MMRLMAMLFLAAASAIPATLAADTTRHCRADWVVRTPLGAVADFGGFDSHGACRGRAWANECRRQARSHAQTCFWDAWARRHSADIISGKHKPPHCVGRATVGVQNYTVRDVKREVEKWACSMPLIFPAKVQVLGRTSGDTRCGGELLLTATYTITDQMCGKQ